MISFPVWFCIIQMLTLKCSVCQETTTIGPEPEPLTPTPKARALEYIPLESKMISASGISSGAVAATQFYLSYSGMMHGLATYASMQYQCGRGSVFKLIPCLMGKVDPGLSIEIARKFSQLGKIDPLTNLQKKRHFIYHGTNDYYVKFENGNLVAQFFQEFSDYVFFRESDSIHSMPSKTCGISCSGHSSEAGTGCAKCNFSAVYEGLNYIYNYRLEEPTVEECRDADDMDGIELVDQSEFLVPFADKTSMLTDGVLYTPPQCRVQPSKCNLHIAFHGCRHSIQNDGIDYIKCSGYLDTADANNFIILFPQTRQSLLDPLTMFHCWDLHGYTGQFFGTKIGSQNQVVLRMVNRILGLPETEYITEEPITEPTTTNDPVDTSSISDSYDPDAVSTAEDNTFSNTTAFYDYDTNVNISTV